MSDTSLCSGAQEHASDGARSLSQVSMAASDAQNHAESIHHLQQQASKLSSEAGILIEGVSSQLGLAARPQKDAESKQQALEKLTQLQVAAQQHAAKLEVSLQMQECYAIFDIVTQHPIADFSYSLLSFYYHWNLA